MRACANCVGIYCRTNHSGNLRRDNAASKFCNRDRHLSCETARTRDGDIRRYFTLIYGWRSTDRRRARAICILALVLLAECSHRTHFTRTDIDLENEINSRGNTQNRLAIDPDLARGYAAAGQRITRAWASRSHDETCLGFNRDWRRTLVSLRAPAITTDTTDDRSAALS